MSGIPGRLLSMSQSLLFRNSAWLLLLLGGVYLLRSKTVSRGMRNNNPGNLRDFGIEWNGRTGTDNAPGGPFVIFDEPANGIRALARDLRTDYTRDGQTTVRALINEFAPPTDNNDTSAYVKSVAGRLSISPDEKIQLPGRLYDLVAAIIIHENGRQPYAPETILKGLHSGWTG